MPLPDATIRIRDGALGVIDPTGAVSAKIGVCSAGPTNTVTPVSDLRALRDTFGTGPLVEAAAHTLAVGGGVVYLVRVVASVAGTIGAVTHAGTGLCVVTTSGAPADGYQVIVKITRDGTNPAAGTAAFQYSLDGGDTYSPEVAVPTSGSYALGDTGVALAFSAASLVTGDTYSFTTVAPGYSTTDLTAAFNALAADARTWKFVHVVGQAASPAASATVAGVLASLLTAAEQAYRFTYAILEAAEVSNDATGDNALIVAFASVATVRVLAAAGTEELVSSLTGRIQTRPAAWPLAARRHLAPIHEDCARVASGPLPGVTALVRDEQTRPGLDAARFATLRTLVGRQGFYITNGNMLAPAGSDFGLVQYREVMDRACAIARAALLAYLGASLRVNPATAQPPATPGAIDERDARAIEADVGGQLRAALLAPGHVSDATVRVNRTDNLLSTRLLRVAVRVLPLAYAKFIEAELGFTNPALETG